jgi:hypothetical protein
MIVLEVQDNWRYLGNQRSKGSVRRRRWKRAFSPFCQHTTQPATENNCYGYRYWFWSLASIPPAEISVYDTPESRISIKTFELICNPSDGAEKLVVVRAFEQRRSYVMFV